MLTSDNVWTGSVYVEAGRTGSGQVRARASGSCTITITSDQTDAAGPFTLSLARIADPPHVIDDATILLVGSRTGGAARAHGDRWRERSGPAPGRGGKAPTGISWDVTLKAPPGGRWPAADLSIGVYRAWWSRRTGKESALVARREVKEIAFDATGTAHQRVLVRRPPCDDIAVYIETKEPAYGVKGLLSLQCASGRASAVKR